MITLALLGLVGSIIFFIGKLSVILAIIGLCFWGAKIFVICSAALFALMILINMVGGSS